MRVFSSLFLFSLLSPLTVGEGQGEGLLFYFSIKDRGASPAAKYFDISTFRRFDISTFRRFDVLLFSSPTPDSCNLPPTSAPLQVAAKRVNLLISTQCQVPSSITQRVKPAGQTGLSLMPRCLDAYPLLVATFYSCKCR